MGDFAEMVESYRWTGAPSKQSVREEAPTPLIAFHPVAEDGLCVSACDGSPTSTDANPTSSPSPSLLDNSSKERNISDGHIYADNIDVSDMPPYLSDFCSDVIDVSHPLRTYSRSSKKPLSRQLAFSKEDLDSRGSKHKNVRLKEINKKPSRKKRRVLSNTINSAEIEPYALPGIYSDSESESYKQNQHSVDASCAAWQQKLATHAESKVPTTLGKKQAFRHVTGQSKSPFFVLKKQMSKNKGSINEKDRSIKESKCLNLTEKNRSIEESKCLNLSGKPCSQDKKIEGLSLTSNADTTIGKHSFWNGNMHLNDEDSGEHSAPSRQLNSKTVIPRKATAKVKKSLYFEPATKPLGQRDISNKTWVPPISVHALIQEELYQDPWKVLVACMLLNKTSGTQMRKIIWDFFDLCPTPEVASTIDTNKIEDIIRGLGLQKKRAQMIQKFSKDYLGKEWSNVGQLHGIGKYATDAYAIFCEGRWREVEPKDHKLVDYWQYLRDTDGLGYGFKDERDTACKIQDEIPIG
ncbi:hypothetical protein KP509_10G006000 [Ceratopteris richardii]|uniref:HhH-GPD domain-containing protein n=1 Tax=Ceratopteris richardii TaxID=49495 RepID=A0A8T2TVX8_CERRI|nr:hypothetical protein KP509_10G006000 [Ceratopteris richardii]